MSSSRAHIADLLACPDCDLLLEQRHIEPGRKACCPRCGHVLLAPKRNSVDKTLALALTGLILFIPAIFMPIMTLDTMGFKQAGSVFDGIQVIYESSYFFVALMVALTSIVFPLVKLSLLFYVSLHLKLKRYPHDLPLFMRCYRHLDEWGMLEVYMLGILVAIIKLHHMAHIHYDFGFFCFIAMLFVALASSVSMDEHEFWERIEERPGGKVGIMPEMPAAISWKTMPDSEVITTREAGFLLCHDCHKLIADGEEETPERCPRCNAAIYPRKQDSLTRTWALVLTAAVFAFPANILPIMRVDFLGSADYSTIMDGIIYFFEEGSYGIGIIILTASVLVPCFKIIGIILILLSIHYKWKTWLKHKTLLFRSIEFIGRWSMLDIFVIALLQTLVSFGNLTSIEIASAATFFLGVVLSTMFAAITFDPRLLWDA